MFVLLSCFVLIIFFLYFNVVAFFGFLLSELFFKEYLSVFCEGRVGYGLFPVFGRSCWWSDVVRR